MYFIPTSTGVIALGCHKMENLLLFRRFSSRNAQFVGEKLPFWGTFDLYCYFEHPWFPAIICSCWINRKQEAQLSLGMADRFWDMATNRLKLCIGTHHRPVWRCLCQLPTTYRSATIPHNCHSRVHNDPSKSSEVDFLCRLKGNMWPRVSDQ